MCQLMEIQLVVYLVACRVPSIDKVEEKALTDAVKNIWSRGHTKRVI